MNRSLVLDLSDPLTLLALVLTLGLGVVLWLALGSARRAAQAVEPLALQMRFLHQTLQELSVAHSQLSGGLSHVADTAIRSQTQMMRLMEERLEDVTRRMGDSLSASAQRTAHSLGELQTRLMAIDKAQQNIEKLSGDVLSLQDILANKQARGAFGEIQLQDILRKALPPDAFSVQATLSNGKRVDCLLHLPNPPGPIAVDAKFPLEAYANLRAATTERDRREAERNLRAHVLRHARDIAERYILPGETADSALMFLPSEAIYAELHAHHVDCIQETYGLRVWIVSPTTLMATLNTMRAVLKDLRMREQAGVIRREIGLLYKDVERLGERVNNLNTHFAQAQKDVAEISVSADKAARRARRLDSFEFEEGEAKTAPLRLL